MSTHSSRTTAYSYVRFSSKKQEQGDSRRRQTDCRAEAYCKRRGWKLSAQTYEDLGVSAYHGKNALVGNLGEFLRAIRQGGVKPGSALIVESLDRISRQGIDEGYDLIKHILKSDVRIVTLSPEREFDRDATRSLSKGALEIQLILERAAEESERKGERVAAARSQERKRVREKGELVTRNVPAWIQERDGKPVLIPERAEAVRTIFRLAGAGYGAQSIIARLNRDEVPPFGRGGHWAKSYVSALLQDRRVLGEFQPKSGDKPEGEPVRGYFPAVVTEAEWLAARAGAAARKRHPRLNGRLGKARVNVFSGLIRHARDGDAYQMTTCRSYGPAGEPTRYQVLINRAGTDSTGRGYSIPYEPFEEAVLSQLKEIDPREILGEAGGGDDEVAKLERFLEGVEAELAEAKAFMDARGFSPTIGQRVLDLEAKKADLTADLARARHEAAHPLAASWDEAKTLAGAVADADDPGDARLRLRAALRRIVEEIWLLVVPRGRGRLCAIQVFFRGAPGPVDLGTQSFEGRTVPTHRRDYLVWYRPASGSFGKPTPAQLKQRPPLRVDDFPLPNLLMYDLRDPTAAECEAKTLESVDLDLLGLE
jgi:DNA invertase Pin-like site-specific DNA recombinase